MRLATCFVTLSFLLALCTGAFCQLPPAPPAPSGTPNEGVGPTPPPAPSLPPGAHPAIVATPWLMQRGNVYVIVGPTNTLGKTRMIRGRISIVAKPARDTKVVSVAILVDGQSIGSAGGDTMGMFGVEYDTTSLVDGTHTFKAIGADNSGKEVWSASTAVDVVNKTVQTSPPPAAKPVQDPLQPAVAVAPVKQTKATVVVKPIVKGAKPAVIAKAPIAKLTPPAKAPVTKATKPAVASKPAAVLPAKTYTSAKHGFSIKAPAGWVAKDKTAAMRPAAPGNGWIEFTSTKASGLVVNVRRMRIDKRSTADTFAKYNPYVSTWQRKNVLNADAFSTNTDTGSKVIHRLIIVKAGLAWMLNCVDANRGSDEGQKLFDSMVASFTIGAKPAPKAIAIVKVAKKSPAKSVAKAAPEKAVAVKPLPKASPAAKPVAKPIAPVAKPAGKPAAKIPLAPVVKH